MLVCDLYTTTCVARHLRDRQTGERYIEIDIWIETQNFDILIIIIRYLQIELNGFYFSGIDDKMKLDD